MAGKSVIVLVRLIARGKLPVQACQGGWEGLWEILGIWLGRGEGNCKEEYRDCLSHQNASYL
jgi:hypothetical protein